MSVFITLLLLSLYIPLDILFLGGGIHFEKYNFENIFIKAVNQHIRMISGGSCDTQERSNDAKNWTLHKILFSNTNCIINCYSFN